MNQHEIFVCILVVVLVAVGIGFPAYLCICGFRSFRIWANGKVQPLFDEGKRISAVSPNNPILQYAVTGFFNIGIEWQQTLYVDEENIESVKQLIDRTASISYKLSAISVVGILYGTVLTWINHRMAKRTLAKYAATLADCSGVD